ncbi:MAG: ABC transporter ATP-binding protein [Chloroflexi bacterium]|nr:MAG: ABC transporter ATP-binding protein [Chloroflexota bacterium]
MGFIMDGLDTEAYDRSYSDRELLRRIWHYFRPYGRDMVLVGLGVTLVAVSGSGGPIIISETVDLLAQNPTTMTIFLMTMGVLLLGATGWAFNFLGQYLSAKVVGNVVLRLREDVFRAAIRHDMSFFDEHSTGRIVSRITSDTQDFATVVTLTTNLVGQVLLVGLLLVWLVNINLWLSLLLLSFAPIAVTLALSFRRIARRVTLDARRVTATINAQIQESISGIMVAKSFRQEAAIYQTFLRNNRQGYRVGLRRGIVLNSIFPVLGASSGVGVAALVYAGGLAVRSELIAPGEWYLFMQAVGFFWFPLINIASFWSQFQDGLSAAERVFALIDAEPRVVQRAAEPVEGPLEGRIEFRHVRFSYTDKEVVLPDFSLTIQPRETVALVGHTGAGKSSIIKLLTRFYEFQDGELLVDGRDIRTLDLRQYRRHIGLVTQTPFLFSGTVGDNIRYACPEASDEEVYRAAMSISEGRWLSVLADGLNTDVGERGSNLSLGQRQLVALARVLLKNPSIFVLDEATASIDPFTEAQIQEGLNLVMRDRTAIVIAHRLSTVRHADRIIVMDHGTIIEEGTHDSLLAQGGHYAELYNTYFRHQSLDYINSSSWRDGD